MLRAQQCVCGSTAAAVAPSFARRLPVPGEWQRAFAAYIGDARVTRRLHCQGLSGRCKVNAHTTDLPSLAVIMVITIDSFLTTLPRCS